MKKKMKGFSLVQVLVSLALLSGVSLGFMQMMKNMDQGNTRAKSSVDEMELRSEINMILGNKNFCRVSLAGNGTEGNPLSPVTFKKQDIDQDNEGLHVELWLSNQAGNARVTKKFSGADSTKNTYGNIKISSIKLIMDNGVGSNYSSSQNHSDIGKIEIAIEKKQGSSDSRKMSLDFPVNLQMSTDANGVTTILSCSLQSDFDTSAFLKNCEWQSNTYSNAYRAYRACNNGKRVVSGTCSCGGDNCGGGGNPGIIYSFAPLKLVTQSECVCTDWTCSNCSPLRISCTGNNCNAFSCEYTRQMGEIYVKIFCCDY